MISYIGSILFIGGCTAGIAECVMYLLGVNSILHYRPVIMSLSLFFGLVFSLLCYTPKEYMK